MQAQLASFLSRPADQSLLPVSTQELLDFLGFRYEAGCGSSTLASAVSAIASDHRVRGLPDPTADFRVKQLLGGARRLRAGLDDRVALSVQDVTHILRSALRSLYSSPVDRAAFGAIIPLAFFLMLRPGEVVAGAALDHTLRIKHVRLNQQQLTVTIPSSKTSAAPFTTTLVARPDIVACPVAAMREYLAVRGAGAPDDIMFIDGRRRPITCQGLTAALRRAGRTVGLDERRLAGHCLRISGASHEAALGLSEVQLKDVGRWSSPAWQRYLRRPVSLLQATPRDRQHYER